MPPSNQSKIRPFDPQLPAFRQEGFQALFEHWSTLRIENSIPAAASLNPRSIAPWLRNLTIMEVELPHAVRYRLAGTSVVERMGIDPTGRNLLDMVNEDMRHAAATLFSTVSTLPCAALTSHTNIASNGRAANILSLFLPLLVPNGQMARVVSLNALQEIVDYFPPAGKVTVGSALNHHSWIDIGFGIPDAALAAAIA